MTKLGVYNHKDLIRDSDSRALLNRDGNSLDKYREEREFKTRLQKMVNEHEQVKNELSEIKSLLKQILQQR